jgi:aspartate kinase
MMKVKVFKFGGASVNSAAGVRNVGGILEKYRGESVMVVVSAMGKTTNALERILQDHLSNDPVSMVERFYLLRDFHTDILHDLFTNKEHPVFAELNGLFEELRSSLQTEPAGNYDEHYDRVVSYGELFSTAILHHYLDIAGIPIKLFDARQLIITDDSFRDARVDWAKTQLRIQKQLFTWFQDEKGRMGLTQGFIGSGPSGKTTTLGREGSDFTAAIIAYALRTKEVTIWKDVPGVLNADPKWFDSPQKLDTLSYLEAIELAYYGASVIHPKTIKPLENANIKLIVRSFLDPEAPGTTVGNLRQWSVPFPIYIRKTDQVLISISPRDFSFIMEEHLSQIFNILSKHRVRANVMQNSAVTFSVCADNDPVRIRPLLLELKHLYALRFNEGLVLYTIRHYNQEAIDRITGTKKVLLEQKTRSTVHLVVDDQGITTGKS